MSQVRLPSGGPLHCERCHAVYENKTWRVGGRRAVADLPGVTWTLSPACSRQAPERRLVGVERTRQGLEILTTSQKLAHRIARELERAFGGRALYEWTDRERQLDATWTPPREGAVVRTEQTRKTRRS